MAFAVGNIIDGRYQLEAQIGRGGMARVFRALNRKNGKRVALKEIVMPDDQEERATLHGWFRRELKALMAIDHPGVVALVDHGEENGMPWVATELLEGTDLQLALETRGPLDDTSVFSVALQGLDALSAAHKIGVVHRDLKPGNLFLCDNGRVVILDFGLARGMNTNVTLSLQKGYNTKILGTPQYWSPEQIQGVTLSVRSDLFSFGSSLFALLVGKPPHAGETPFEVAAKIMTRQRKKLLEERPETSPELAAAIENLIEYEPEKRPVDAGDALLRFRELQSEFGSKTQVRLASARKHALPTGETNVGPMLANLPTPLAPTGQYETVVGSPLNVAVTPTNVDVRLAEGTQVVRVDPPGPQKSNLVVIAGSMVGLAAVGAGLGMWWTSKQQPSESQVVTTIAPTPSASAPVAVVIVEPPPPQPATQPAALPSPTDTPTIEVAKEPIVEPDKPVVLKPVVIEKREPVGDGTLKLMLKQWAEVEIDGKSYGRQQIAAQFKLPSGKHDIVVKNTKFGERRFSVVVKANQESPLKIDFER